MCGVWGSEVCVGGVGSDMCVGCGGVRCVWCVGE